MKTLAILILAIGLTACAPQPTLEQLEDQAVLTGDWSEVERREWLIKLKAQRNAQKNLRCPSGHAKVCNRSYGSTNCGCVDRQTAGLLFTDW